MQCIGGGGRGPYWSVCPATSFRFASPSGCSFTPTTALQPGARGGKTGHCFCTCPYSRSYGPRASGSKCAAAYKSIGSATGSTWAVSSAGSQRPGQPGPFGGCPIRPGNAEPPSASSSGAWAGSCSAGTLGHLHPLLGPLFARASGAPRQHRPIMPAMVLKILDFFADHLRGCWSSGCRELWVFGEVA